MPTGRWNFSHHCNSKEMKRWTNKNSNEHITLHFEVPSQRSRLGGRIPSVPRTLLSNMCSGEEIKAPQWPQRQDHHRVMWPEERDESKSWLLQVYERWTFSYMNAILDREALRKRADSTNNRMELTQQDLFPVPTPMRAKHLSQEFHTNYAKYADRGQNARLAWTLWRLAAPTFIPAGFCQLLSVICQVLLPLLVRELLLVLEENPNEKVIQQGLPYALSIFAASLLNAFGNHRHRHLALKSGVVMRAAAVDVLYQHVLQLTPAGRVGLTAGEVTNLMATDTQKLFEVTQEGHLIWALPLSVVLVTLFLWLIMGPTTLVGIAVLMLFVPLVERITSSMLKIRKVRVKMTDRRIEITNAMLQGVSCISIDM